MRISIVAQSAKKCTFSYDYQYALHSAIYHLIAASSKDYASFLHDTGFVDNQHHLKLFTFSKLYFYNARFTPRDIRDVQKIQFTFSTPVPLSLEHIVLGIFSKNAMHLNVYGSDTTFDVIHVESLPEPAFTQSMRFICLSPIAVAHGHPALSGKHYLDYMQPDERELICSGLYNNLVAKYRTVHNAEYAGSSDFSFSFDPQYIVKRKGKIRKNIKFKDSRIIAMEAPFTITADPQLIKLGYECGFGENNSAGFGMVEVVDG